MQVGKLGEKIACKYLISKKYNIICTNFRTRFGEIDIIAEKNQEIVFIEVKTRLSKKFGYPAEAVNLKKQNHIIKTSNYYIKINSLLDCKMRYDIIEVCIRNKIAYVKHIENVFF